MSADARLVRALVACYPAGWRRRYGDEYAQLLCDLRVDRHPSLIVDSVRGAVRAHGGEFMSDTSPMTVVVWATGLFVLAGIGFAKLAEDFTAIARGPYVVLVVASALALLALVVAALPGVRALRGGALRYLAVPVVGVAVWFGVLRLASGIADGHSVHSGPNVAGFVLLAATGIAVLAATAWAATAVLRRAPVTRSPRWRLAAMVTVPAGMALATLAALLWGLQVRSGDPAAFHGHQGIVATPFVPSWIAVLVALAVATGLAATAGRRSLAAAR